MTLHFVRPARNLLRASLSLFFYLLLTFSILVGLLAPAKARQYPIKTYTEADGLPSAGIKSIAQDLTGRMWFATRSGIVSYDGKDMTVYGVQDGLPALDHSAVVLDRHGVVWVLSSRGVLSTFENGVWSRRATYRKIDYYSDHHILMSSMEKNGRTEIVFTMSGNDLVLYSCEDNSMIDLRFKDIERPVTIFAITAVDNRLFVATSEGLFDAVADSLDTGLRRTDWASDLPVYSVVYDENNDVLWLAGRSCICKYSDGRIDCYDDIKELSRVFTEGFFSGVADNLGGFYFGQTTNLFRFDGIGLIESIGRVNGLVDDGTSTLFRDREGNIWVGGLRGLSKITSLRFTSYTKDNGLFEDEVSVVLERSSGDMVLGHPTGLTFLGTDMRTMKITSRQDLHRILDMAEDASGALWIAASYSGLVRLDLDGKRTDYGVECGFELPVTSVLFDREGRLWTGGMNHLFLYESGEFVPFPLPEASVKRPVFIKRLFESDDGTIYLATSTTGIYSIKDGDAKNINVSDNQSGDNVYSIYKTDEGTIFAGTGDGLYAGRGGEFEESLSPLPEIDRPVYFIIKDQQERIWFGTDNGVFRWSGESLDYLTVEDGLVGRETNRAAGLVDMNGDVWIGTDRGVSVYREQYDVQSDITPLVELVSLEASGREYPLTEPIELDHENRSFTINFRVLSFVNEKKNRIKSRLEGYESDWLDPYISPQQQIRYTNLPAGKYRFHIMAAGYEQSWSDVISSPVIKIKKPFWAEIWFIILAVLTVILFVLFVSGYILQRRSAGWLKREVERRVEEMKMVEKELASARQMKSIGVLAGGIAHDFNNFLAAMIGNLSMLEISTDLTPRDRELASEVLQAAERSKSLTKQLLTFSQGGAPVLQPGDIRDVIRDTATFILKGTNSVCSFEFADDLKKVEMDPDQISQVIDNLLLNARQAMPGGGTVIIRAENYDHKRGTGRHRLLEIGEYVKIEIEDEGEGISGENLGSILDPYYTTRESGSGLGLPMAYSVVKRHGGILEIMSEPGKGTVVTFYLPVSEKRLEPVSDVDNVLAGKGPARILIMEDDDLVSMLVVKMAGKRGFKTEVVKDGAEAIKRYREALENGMRWDMVIMDLTIPGGMGGRETIGHILEMDPAAKVVVSSGYSNDDVLAKYSKYGFVGRLAKPFTFDDFNRVIDGILAMT
ncbi:MAG: response regulator [Candidatus Krumholzibacteriota bacterium]|nr:response regulator [Candidatus Krumholzibacteriota bacterium]